MLRFVVRRLLWLPIMLFGVITLVFLLTNITPSKAIYIRLGESGTAADVQNLIERYNLDKPILQRYFAYMAALFKGDLGESMAEGRPVARDLAEFLPASIELVLSSLVLIAILGVLLGIASAVYKNRWPDTLARGIAVTGLAMPQFWLAIMLYLLFFYQLNLLPGGGRISPMIGPPRHATGLYILDSVLAGDWDALVSSIRHLILPVITLSLTRLSTMTRMTRTAFLDVLSKDFMLTHQSHGYSRFRNVFRYGLKNALSPILSVLGLLIGGLFAGTFLVETVFSFPGVGYYAITAITHSDFQPAIASAIFFSLLYGIVNVLVDVGYAALDPRVRY